MSANEYITRNIKDTLKQLDEDVKTDNSIEVIYLKFIKAQEVASILVLFLADLKTLMIRIKL